MLQVVGHPALLPLHAYGAQLGLPIVLATTMLQLPSEHSLQAPSHALSQHLLSAQKPLAHCASSAPQDWPLAFLQLPAPSQALLPLHAGLAFVSLEPLQTLLVHVPAAFAHDLQESVQLDSQQRPSTQKPLAHSVAAEQVCPLASLQAPAPSHALLPLHAGELSVLSLVTLEHVPCAFAQVLHAVPQAELQQRPSLQKVDRHSEPLAALHASPCFSLHSAPALQASLPEHVSASSTPPALPTFSHSP